jgi:hypothetical protein
MEFFLYCLNKKKVTRNNYLFYYGLGIDALNTKSRLEKKAIFIYLCWKFHHLDSNQDALALFLKSSVFNNFTMAAYWNK